MSQPLERAYSRSTSGNLLDGNSKKPGEEPVLEGVKCRLPSSTFFLAVNSGVDCLNKLSDFGAIGVSFL